MSDCADTDSELFWKTCWTSPDTTIQKKNKNKNKKRKRDKVETVSNKNVGARKKKNTFKDVMKLKRDKKKDKRKKKKTEMSALEDGFILSQSSIAEHRHPDQTPVKKPKTSNSDNLKLLQPHKVTSYSLPKKNPKTKKKVAFDLSPGYIPVKRPKLSMPKSQLRDSSFSKSEGVKNNANLLKEAVKSQTQGKPQDHDSQCTDDTNSQDLFITQKTFMSFAEPSTGETNEESGIVQQEGESHTPQTELTQSHKDTNTHVQHSMTLAQVQLQQFNQNHRNTNKKHQESLEMQTLAEQIHTSQKNRYKSNPSSQAQMETNSKKVSTLPKRENSYLRLPIVINTHTSNQKTQRHLHKPADYLQVSTTSTSTQTENFFTTQLSSHLSFQLQATVSAEELKPLDLSLPHRMRTDSSKCSLDSLKLFNVECKDDSPGDQRPSSSPIAIKDEDEEASKRPSYFSGVTTFPQASSSTAQHNDETTPSPQSESEPKFSDTTTSSEDNDHTWRSSKVDLRQVKAVQMRLNESFFFKTKGERQSPRPESPLMKLSQGREKKSRIRHSGYVV